MNNALTNRARQSGAALVIALIFLLLMTMLSTSTMRSATMQERMSGNLRDYNVGFQAAEAALRDAENYLRTNSDTLPDFDDTNGHYVVNSANRPVWHEYPPTDGTGYLTAAGVTGTAEAPKYYLERLSTARPPGSETEAGTAVDEIFYFRITAVGFGQAVDNGGTPLTSVVLSSVYRSR